MEVKPLSSPTILSEEPYLFSFCRPSHGTTINAPGAWTLYCHEGSGTVTDGRESRDLIEGHVVHGNGPATFTGDAALFLVANPHAMQAVEFLDLVTLPKLVTKPWGKELWLTSERGDYCMKCIHINAGHQTSLQYHERKVETTVVMSGSAEIIGEDFNQTAEAPFYVHIEPPTLHRIKAVSDIILVEASTADLDDVIRVQDDSGRGNGRINSEHQ